MLAQDRSIVEKREVLGLPLKVEFRCPQGGVSGVLPVVAMQYLDDVVEDF
jgi:hypothetical protein